MKGANFLFDHILAVLIPQVKLALQGACGSCPSSTTTMKMGIERVLNENFLNMGGVSASKRSLVTVITVLRVVAGATSGKNAVKMLAIETQSMIYLTWLTQCYEPFIDLAHVRM